MPRVCNNGGAVGRGHAASSTDERSAVLVWPLGPRGDDRGAALPRPAFFVVKLGSCSAVHLTSSVIIVSSLAAVIFAVAVNLACDARVESGFLGEAAIARLRAGYGRAERTVFVSSRRAAGEDQTQLICLTVLHHNRS